jgi:hypothetical protein
VSKAKDWHEIPLEIVVNPRCLAIARWVNTKAGHGIYLVDNEQGAMISANPDVYCAELD